MENVNERYLKWLTRTVGFDPQSSFYSLLFRKLYKTSYIWMIEGDQDRAKDGLQLRIFFSEECLCNVPDGPVSVLEVLVALSIRIDEWLSGGEEGPHIWFFAIIHNLGLDGFTDEFLMDPGESEKVDGILERWLQREYREDGFGGIFPLQNAPCDQRYCDLEYQLQLYLKENRQLIGVDFG